MLLTEEFLEILSLKGDCTCSSEATLVKMPHNWKSRVKAHIDWIYHVHVAAPTFFHLHGSFQRNYRKMTMK